MIRIAPQMRIMAAIEPADFRRGIDGLARLCKDVLRHDPFNGWVFVFRNRSATALKILVYDGRGFWLCHKRLSSGRFRWWPAGHLPMVPARQPRRRRRTSCRFSRRPVIPKPPGRRRCGGRSGTRRSRVRRIETIHRPTQPCRPTLRVGARWRPADQRRPMLRIGARSVPEGIELLFSFSWGVCYGVSA